MCHVYTRRGQENVGTQSAPIVYGKVKSFEQPTVICMDYYEPGAE